MPAPIALQLYSIRHELATDFESTIRKVADMGYIGVEPAGFDGSTLEEAVKLFQNLQLTSPACHCPLPLGANKQRSLDTVLSLQAKYLVSGLGPEDFATIDLIKSSCDQFNRASAIAAEHHLILAIHNHWWEFEQIDDKLVVDVMLDFLSPEVHFEFDTYWAQTAGANPVAALRKLGNRAPLLHIKDGPCDKDLNMTAVGDGTMDFPAIFETTKQTAQWAIVELDRCSTDMMEAVQRSYDYLTTNALALGK